MSVWLHDILTSIVMIVYNNRYPVIIHLLLSLIKLTVKLYTTYPTENKSNWNENCIINIIEIMIWRLGLDIFLYKPVILKVHNQEKQTSMSCFYHFWFLVCTRMNDRYVKNITIFSRKITCYQSQTSIWSTLSGHYILN